MAFRLKLNTKSVFFGFIAGFCTYLILSHLLLASPGTDTAALNISTKYLPSAQQIANIVPWVYYKDIESVINSDIFPPEKNKPPKKELVDEAKLIQLEQQRKSKGVLYGGADKDAQHLGGWKLNDSDTYERELWDWAIDTFNISSVMDIGCGVGCSTIYFNKHANISDVLCVEGSLDAIKNSLVPDISMHHDYTLGPFWPNKVYDMVWSAEFLEHVTEEYMDNYLATFKAAKILFVTHSEWGGWHHVNVHPSEWWIYKFEQHGFQYMDKITEEARDHCPVLGVEFRDGPNAWHDLHTDGNRKNSHFHYRGQVFFNKLFLNKLTVYDQKLLRLLAK